MKFAIKFYQGCRTLQKADEIIIKYNEKSASLIDFVQKWEEHQRIIVDITELETPIEECLTIFEEARKLHKEFAVLLSYNQDYVDLAEMNIPFFFIEGVSCFDDLANQIQLGVSDVYIINELGFNLEKISELCHKNNVQVRVYPNVAQSGSKLNMNTFQQFYIRPDAVQLYEEFVDVFEFFGPLDRQPVLYDIYYDERWLGNLNEVILGLNKVVNNQTIMPYFDTSRIRCNKRCNFGKCDICGAVENLGKALEEKGVGLTRKRATHDERDIDEKNMWNEPAAIISLDDEVSEET